MQTVADYWIEQGVERGMERGIEQGMEQGIEQGMERGIEQGMEQGIERGIEQSILDLLEVRLGVTDPELAAQITAVTDLTTLRQLLRYAALAETAEEFRKHLS